MELTILMPCLNERETLAVCIDKAQAFLERSGIAGEVLIADNGSTDGSITIAQQHGARVVHVPMRGYGAALIHGIREAKGAYVIMGDSDDSYDFSDLTGFVDALRSGSDLVMGNRFAGGIEAGAMPFLHKYLGNPVLSFIGRLFFHIRIGDFHCGLRGFSRRKMLELDLQSTGMEFASERVVRAALAGYRVSEVPTVLRKDGRSRPPHLRTWRDGWRHLRFLLLFSPKWLFFYPGLAIFAIGFLLAVIALPGQFHIAPNIALDVHTAVLGCMTIIIGTQCITFSLVARRYATSRGFLPPGYRMSGLAEAITLERALIFSGILLLAGLVGIGYCIYQWWRVDLGPLPYGQFIRTLIASGTAVVIGLQVAFTSFLAAVLEVKSPHASQDSTHDQTVMQHG